MVTELQDNDIVWCIKITIVIALNIRYYMVNLLYDGDQITCKGVYTQEANEELREFLNSKQNFMDFGCKPLRSSTADVIQSIYALTKVLSNTNITKSESIQYK